MKVGDPACAKTEAGPLILEREVKRVDSWIREAVENGGRVLAGGCRLSKTCYQPTLIINPPCNLHVSTDEIFWPVAYLYGYRDMQQAIAETNRLPFTFQVAVFSREGKYPPVEPEALRLLAPQRGLFATVGSKSKNNSKSVECKTRDHSRNCQTSTASPAEPGGLPFRLEFALRAARMLDASAVMVNDHTAFRMDWMPFAGRRRSGLGTGGIPYTMRDITREKMIVLRSQP